jgi:hypothetical protein
LATAKLLPTAPFGPHQPLACLSVPYKCDTSLQLWRPPCEACCGDSCGSLHPVSQHLEFASRVAGVVLPCRLMPHGLWWDWQEIRSGTCHRVVLGPCADSATRSKVRVTLFHCMLAWCDAPNV